MEARERSSSVIISGRSLPSVSPGENCVSVASSIFSSSLRQNLPENSILTAYRIGSPPRTQAEDKRSILVKLREPYLASDLLRSSKTVRVPGLYVNENLTSIRHAILRVLRNSKRSHPGIVAGCGSIGGRVYAWVKTGGSPSNQNRKLYVNNNDQLHKYCDEILNSQLSALEPDWSF